MGPSDVPPSEPERSTAQPNLTIIIGANGAGKTTWSRRHRDSLPRRFYNADSIAEGLGSADDPTRQREARTFVDARVEDDIANRRDFGFESTYSGQSRPNIVRKARRAGYTVTAVFIGTKHSSVNIKRVRKRVAEGGHHVDRSEIIRRWHAAWKNLTETWKEIADLTVLDNSGTDPRKVARKTGERMWRSETSPEWAKATPAEIQEDPRMSRARRVHRARTRHPDPEVRVEAHLSLSALEPDAGLAAQALRAALAADPPLATMDESVFGRVLNAPETGEDRSLIRLEAALRASETAQARTEVHEAILPWQHPPGPPAKSRRKRNSTDRER